MPALLPSELPVLATARHHWVVLLRPPHKLLLAALAVILVAAILQPNPMALVLVVVVGAALTLRWHSWRAERVMLTSRRVLRVRGVPETTSSEASLRVDRVSGAVLVQTPLGKLLNYGTIELEAPGQHPDVRRLETISHPNAFYQAVRAVIFGEPGDLLPPGVDATVITAPLPLIRRPRQPE